MVLSLVYEDGFMCKCLSDKQIGIAYGGSEIFLNQHLIPFGITEAKVMLNINGYIFYGYL
jgi:hypothetical protein